MNVVRTEALSGMQAVTTVGAVLGEAVVLYAGYGTVVRSVGANVFDVLVGEYSWNHCSSPCLPGSD
jgi:hypothetical protein